MASKSKLKGSAFETKVKNILTKQFKIQFERVPHSGALPYLKGDVWAPKNYNDWPYCVECKHYKELNFNTLLTAKSNDIWKFWDQTLEESICMEKKPLLIFRWDRGKDFVMWDDDIEVEDQMNIRAFGYNVKLAELTKWLSQIKLN